MGTVTKHFDEYKIYYFSGKGWQALINCYKGTNLVGKIIFVKDDAAIPPNKNNSWGPSIHYGLGRFNDIISILRQEKPLVLLLDLASLIGNVATSEHEPVGEEESARE